MVNKLRFIFLLICSSWFMPAYAAVDAFVDRSTVVANESFTLSFEVDGTVVSEPDFAPLQVYFDILNRSQSTNMTMINGNISRKVRWDLVLIAKKSGNYTIPAIAFGTEKSQPLDIKVVAASATPANQDADLFLSAEVSHKSVYVQSQVIYTIKFFRAVEIASGRLSEPKLNDADAIILRLGDDKTYETRRNNRRFIVTERRYAIFPQQSGELRIDPVEFIGQIAAQRRSFFDPAPPGRGTRRLYSEKIKLDVKSVPAGYTYKHWLPADKLELSEEWSQQKQFKVGEPLTRTITLQAQGLSAAQLPPLRLPNVDGLKQYPDQPLTRDKQTNSGIIGIRQKKFALIPTQAGDYTLPEVIVPWWDRNTDKLMLARLPARTITITGAAATATRPAPAVPVLPETAIDTSASDGGSSVVKPQVVTHAGGPWFIVSIVFGGAWLLTLLAWYMRSRSGSKEQLPSPADNDIGRDQSRRQLKAACTDNNAQTCKQALLQWAKAQWPDKRIHNLGQIAALVDASLARHIERLNQSLYGMQSATWQAEDLYASLCAFEREQRSQVSAKHKVLPELFRLQSQP